ncbi:hypothetical protein Syun_013018 [Stephania yunnanensis]|uniref:Alpha/beta hydrolase fold-3 domain-containing protein n=1 Tax=Stephania yunnanensis TaxID=152371 RepID=A0AAP0PFW9_9MAGN
MEEPSQKTTTSNHNDNKKVDKVDKNIDPYEHLKITLNPDGSLNRSQFPLVPPNCTDSEPITTTEPVLTKDITFDEETKSWLRLYNPINPNNNNNNEKKYDDEEEESDENSDKDDNDNDKEKEKKSNKKLPIILYFHAGGMILYHTNTIFNNEPCTRFASELHAIVASVEYRLAPENRLPSAYQDAIDALLWLKTQASSPNPDPWLANHADFSRCYLMGCSSGANIAYRTALTLPTIDIEPVKVVGLIMNQPLFGSEERTRSERRLETDMAMPMCVFDLMWKLALPEGSSRDHEYSNFMVKGEYGGNIGKLPRTLVRGFEGDPLLDRQMEFVRLLMRHRVRVTAHFGEFGFHNIDFVDAKRHLTMIKYMREFIID